jgi:hypothetical protein
MAPPEPPIDPTLGDLLKAEADRYEPDLDRIMDRIRTTQSSSPTAVRVGPRRRSGWLIPAVAAGLVVLIAGAITAVDRFHSSPTSAPLQVATEPASTTAPSTAMPSHKASQPTAPTVTSSTPAKPPKSHTSKAPPPSGPNPPAAGIQLDFQAATPGQSVTLPGSSTDWIVAGGAPGPQTVRNKDGDQLISGPHVTGNPTSSAVPGPFKMSWTDGIPDNIQPTSTQWLSVHGIPNGPKTGMLINVPASSKSSTLVLYLGATGTDGQLVATLDGQSKVTTHRLKAGSAEVVTIQFRTTGPAGSLAVQLNCGAGGAVNLAAAVLH